MHLALQTKIDFLINMIKKRNFSIGHDFKAGIFCKLTLFLGIFLLIIFIIFKVFSFILTPESTGFLKTIYDFSQSSSLDTIVAFSIIFIGIGILLYFLHCQFEKLKEIADELENEEELIENKND